MIKGIDFDPARKAEYYQKGYWTKDTILDCWNRSAEAGPDREYIADDRGNRYTYAQLDKKATRLAAWMQHSGIRPGDVVGFQIPIWSEFAIVMMACLKAGAVMHPIARSADAGETAYLLGMSGCRLFICPTYFRGADYESRVISVMRDVPSIRDAVLVEKEHRKTTCFSAFEDITGGDAYSFDPVQPASPDDVAVILNTSGTTNRPKGVLLTHNNILFSERWFNKELLLDDGDIMFMPAPLNHATGFMHGLVSPMIMGAKVILQQRFEPEKAIDILNKEGCTYSMGATPFIYEILRLLEEQDKKLDTMHLYLCGGAPVPGKMVHRAMEHGITLCEVYGSTESAPHIFVRPDEVLKWNGTVSGRAMTGVETKIVDTSGREVPPGVQGEELSKGPNVFVGYLNNPEATEEALDADGWFYSGDYAVSDAGGNIHIVGRKKDIIIRGGENISINRINDYVDGCPGIRDHSVVGMPDQRLGERICLYAVRSEGCDTTPGLEDVLEYMRGQNVPKAFWPERLEWIDAIPRTESGKVKRYVLEQDIRKRIKHEEDELA